MYRNWLGVLLTTLLLLFSAVLAGPVAPTTQGIERRADIDPGRLNDLKKQYRGIYWDAAVEECSLEQFNIITEVLRKIVEEIFPLTGTRYDRASSPALNRFFIRPFEGGMDTHWWSNNDLSITYLRIIGAMENVEQFPTKGKRGRSQTRANQIKFKCKEFDVRPCGKNTAAQTNAANIDGGDGWSIVFCPLFWARLRDPSDNSALDYINNVANQPPKPVSTLFSLRSYEHALMHEFFHVDKASGLTNDNHISDLKAILPGYKDPVLINGATLSHRFAWVNTKPDPSRLYTGPNKNVARNADNYAWYYTNLYFIEKWGWNDDGRSLVLAPEDEDYVDPIESEDINGPVLVSDDSFTSPPAGCFYINTSSLEAADWFCPYRGEDQSTWLDELTHPFESNGGCQLSFECHMPVNGTHDVDPSCKCNCDGQDTPLADLRCDGFEGTVSSSASSTMPPSTTTQAPTAPSSTKPASSSKGCTYNWCGAPFCEPACGP